MSCVKHNPSSWHLKLTRVVMLLNQNLFDLMEWRWPNIPRSLRHVIPLTDRNMGVSFTLQNKHVTKQGMKNTQLSACKTLSRFRWLPLDELWKIWVHYHTLIKHGHIKRAQISCGKCVWLEKKKRKSFYCTVILYNMFLDVKFSSNTHDFL